MAELNDRGFRKASEIGDVGERFYRDMLERYKAEGKIASYIDLTDNRIAQLLDCDFVVFTALKEDGEEYTEQDAEGFLLQKGKHPNFCHFIEIKTDTRISDTGNVYLEWIAHNVVGCFGGTRADNWIYCGVGLDGSLKGVWSIDFKKLRGLITSDALNPGNIKEYKDKKTENFAYIVKIDMLIQLGAARELLSKEGAWK